VCKVTTWQTYDGPRAVLGGLCDPHMGTMERDLKCLTCGGGSGECPGHFGHIELEKPVYNVGFITKTLHVLRSVCFYCSKVPVPSLHLSSFPIISAPYPPPARAICVMSLACLSRAEERARTHRRARTHTHTHTHTSLRFSSRFGLATKSSRTRSSRRR
jgi:hypothetical protein